MLLRLSTAAEWVRRIVTPQRCRAERRTHAAILKLIDVDGVVRNASDRRSKGIRCSHRDSAGPDPAQRSPEQWNGGWALIKSQCPSRNSQHGSRSRANLDENSTIHMRLLLSECPHSDTDCRRG